MQNLHIQHEGDGLVFGQEKDQIRAFGQMIMLSTLAPLYAKETVFALTERLQAAVEAGTYTMAFEKVQGDSGIALPVGFLTWGNLSRTCAVMFAERLRPLRPDEHKSGNNHWVLDMVAPLGHGTEVVRGFFAMHEGCEQIKCTRFRDGKWREETVKRGAYVKAIKET